MGCVPMNNMIMACCGHIFKWTYIYIFFYTPEFQHIFRSLARQNGDTTKTVGTMSLAMPPFMGLIPFNIGWLIGLPIFGVTKII